MFFRFLQNFGDHIDAGRFVSVNGAEERNLVPHISRAYYADFLEVINVHILPPERIAISWHRLILS
jgi:hypothetical protein